MPRPPQSYVSQQKTEADKEGSTEEPKAAYGEDQNIPMCPSTTDHQASLVSCRLEDKTQENLTMAVNASISANAAEPNLETTQSTHAYSQNVDASGESTEWSPMEVLANPWSLHIPEDLASASDAVEVEAALERHGQHTHELSNAQNNEGSAAGAEVIPEESSTVFPADGACGAVDVGQDQVANTQSSQLIGQSAEVSTAGSAESSQPSTILESSTQKPNVEKPEAITPKQPSRPQKLKTTGELSSDSVKIETHEAEKQKDTCAVSDPQKVANDAAKETDFKPVNEKIKTFLGKGEETVSIQATEGETGTHSATSKASDEKEIGMRVKGDMVVVGDRDSPSSTESTDTKGKMLSFILFFFKIQEILSKKRTTFKM